MHLTLIHTAPAPTGQLSLTEHQDLSSVLWGWLSLACAATRSELRRDPRAAILDAAIASIDRGSWLQDVAVLPPMVLSAVRAAAMLAHLSEPASLQHWLRINDRCLYIDQDVGVCRAVLQLNTTLESISSFDDEASERIQLLCSSLIRFHSQPPEDRPAGTAALL